jgi:hypothetical protein
MKNFINIVAHDSASRSEKMSHRINMDNVFKYAKFDKGIKFRISTDGNEYLYFDSNEDRDMVLSQLDSIFVKNFNTE